MCQILPLCYLDTILSHFTIRKQKFWQWQRGWLNILSTLPGQKIEVNFEYSCLHSRYMAWSWLPQSSERELWTMLLTGAIGNSWWWFEIGHSRDIYTTETGKHYKSGISPQSLMTLQYITALTVFQCDRLLLTDILTILKFYFL